MPEGLQGSSVWILTNNTSPGFTENDSTEKKQYSVRESYDEENTMWIRGEATGSQIPTGHNQGLQESLFF